MVQSHSYRSDGLLTAAEAVSLRLLIRSDLIGPGSGSSSDHRNIGPGRSGSGSVRVRVIIGPSDHPNSVYIKLTSGQSNRSTIRIL